MGATVTEYVFDMIPWVEDEKAIIKAEAMTIFDRDYFIIARTLKGARFFSEFFSWDDIKFYYDSYVSMLRYFGGGIIEIYEQEYEDYNLVFSKVIW